MPLQEVSISIGTQMAIKLAVREELGDISSRDLNWAPELLTGVPVCSAMKYGFNHVIDLSGGQYSHGFYVNIPGIRVCHSWTVHWYNYAILSK